MSDDFEFKWAGAQPIDVVGAASIRIDPAVLERFAPGAFTFADGTTEGWTLDQMYDATNHPPTKLAPMQTPPQLSAGFTLSNHFGLGLAATTNYLVGPKSADSLGFYFKSPDLQGRAGWDDCTGYRLDLRRDYFCWFNNPSLHQVHLQAEFTVPNQTELELVFEVDPTDAPGYHDIAHAQTYAMSWKADEFSQAGWMLRHVRVFCKMVNVAAVAGIDLASGSKGSWLIGNVRPLH